MMECNKEEAIRAKELAETKMQNKDFLGAQKIALKAQRLYPELENISQLLMVCDVHVSAESKSLGNEKNFYEILKIESTADEISIKKQYRKFALLLHPDKNKFAGASDAFKLIGEAQRVLLDRGTRSVYDAKLKNSRTNRGPPQHQASNNPNIRTQTWSQNVFTAKVPSPFTSFNPQQQQSQKPPQPTFWTMCPHCVVKYQYYRDVINKTLACQRCKKTFIGHEIKDQAPVNPTTPWAYKPNNGVKVGSQRNTSVEPRARDPVVKAATSEVRRDSKVEPKVTAKVNGKRKKQIDESSESSDSDSDCSSESEEEVITEENGNVKVAKDFGCSRENLRRSSRSKTNVSYKENLSDDEDLRSSSKKAKSSGSFRADEDPVLDKEIPNPSGFEGSSKPSKADDLDKVKLKAEKETRDLNATRNGGNINVEANGESSPGTSPDGVTDPEIFDYPDPDFNDFDKLRGLDCFEVGQIWAVYDTMGGMPRFYARVSRILSRSAFKLKITWLEPNPEDDNENKWVDAGLPVSCGNLRKGNTETNDDRLMFSHQVDWEKGSKRDTFKIYPQKGETWALFKNWDMNWHSNPKRKFEFEFVEITSVYHEDTGVSVAYLSKIKGFSCLFCRTPSGGDSFKISRSHLFRFSHRIPSFLLSGEERDDVPKDSFELDPASLPSNIEEIDIPKPPKVEVETVVISESDSPVCSVKDDTKSDSEGNSYSGEESPEAYEIPEPEFFNFDAEKSREKFQPGQFWALYGDEDGLPKYYAFIKKVDHEPRFELQVTWLSACPSKNTLKYADKLMPIGCGMFKHSKGETLPYTNTSAFSHRLNVEPTDKMDEFGIYPRKGEVWAVYKKWKIRMTRSDLKNCEYDIVEILEVNDLSVKGVVLEMVSGHNSVFKARKNNGSLVTVQIEQSYLLKFSHQIPAFPLAGEKGGSLRGCWELDPAALPIKMFSSS